MAEEVGWQIGPLTMGLKADTSGWPTRLEATWAESALLGPGAALRGRLHARECWLYRVVSS